MYGESMWIIWSYWLLVSHIQALFDSIDRNFGDSQGLFWCIASPSCTLLAWQPLRFDAFGFLMILVHSVWVWKVRQLLIYLQDSIAHVECWRFWSVMIHGASSTGTHWEHSDGNSSSNTSKSSGGNELAPQRRTGIHRAAMKILV